MENPDMVDYAEADIIMKEIDERNRMEDVYDEYEHPKYFVKAEFLTLGHQIHVYNQAGNEIGMVKQRFPSLLPAFGIEVNGKECGSIQKMFSFLKSRYEVDYNG